MNETDAIWLAGFVDGEGCITIKKIRVSEATRKRGGHRPLYAPKVTISNTNRGILEYIQQKIGTGKIYTQKAKSRGSKWKTGYNMDIVALEDVRKLLERILPHLKLKKSQAIILMGYVQRRQGLTPSEKQRKGSSYTKEDVMAFEKIRELNRKGTTVEQPTPAEEMK